MFIPQIPASPLLVNTSLPLGEVAPPYSTALLQVARLSAYLSQRLATPCTVEIATSAGHVVFALVSKYHTTRITIRAAYLVEGEISGDVLDACEKYIEQCKLGKAEMQSDLKTSMPTSPLFSDYKISGGDFVWYMDANAADAKIRFHCIVMKNGEIAREWDEVHGIHTGVGTQASFFVDAVREDVRKENVDILHDTADSFVGFALGLVS